MSPVCKASLAFVLGFTAECRLMKAVISGGTFSKLFAALILLCELKAFGFKSKTNLPFVLPHSDVKP